MARLEYVTKCEHGKEMEHWMPCQHDPLHFGLNVADACTEASRIPLDPDLVVSTGPPMRLVYITVQDVLDALATVSDS